MRAILPLLLLLAGCAPEGGATAGGIVSLNPCADQLLIALAPPGEIAAISHYSRDPASSSIPADVARRFRATAGTAEEVIALKPDLVIATNFTPAASRDAFQRAGLKTLYLGSPTTLADSRAQVMEVARAVKAEARGRALVAQMDAAVARNRWDGAPVPALLYLSGDLANGSGTLLDEMMGVAGFRNAAGDLGLAYTGTLPVETLLRRPPEVILSPDGGGRTAEIRRRLLMATGARTREVPFSSALINCGGPTVPAALDRLAQVRREVGK